MGHPLMACLSHTQRYKGTSLASHWLLPLQLCAIFAACPNSFGQSQTSQAGVSNLLPTKKKSVYNLPQTSVTPYVVIAVQQLRALAIYF